MLFGLCIISRGNAIETCHNSFVASNKKISERMESNPNKKITRPKMIKKRITGNTHNFMGKYTQTLVNIASFAFPRIQWEKNMISKSIESIAMHRFNGFFFSLSNSNFHIWTQVGFCVFGSWFVLNVSSNTKNCGFISWLFAISLENQLSIQQVDWECGIRQQHIFIHILFI